MRILGLLIALLLFVAPQARAGNVGFEEISVPNGSDAPLLVGIWYPTAAAPSPGRDVAVGATLSGAHLPLVVFSHGTGGWYDGHADTAMALARAGFVVAAPSHTGDTYRDESRAAMIWIRSQQIHRVLDYMLAEWRGHERIDAARVGMFGFSAGGFTTLVVAGGAPDLTRVAAHCAERPDAFECGVVKRAGSGVSAAVAQLPPSVWVHDARVRAAVVAAPALGYTFGRDGLKGVTLPVQLWKADNDHVLPAPGYADAVHADLPRPPEFHAIANADHFDFMAPCNDQMRAQTPQICTSRPGFDRAAFHTQFNRAVVAFFEKTLR
jgi:predicted dienelactone hydrolase